jgi:RIO kinase 1
MSDSLDLLLADGVIDAVIGQLKTGKEAEVWLVQHAGQVIAAKIYKERHARNFRNNVGYREGREVRNSRTRRAMEKGSSFGQDAAEEAWKSAESDSLYTLHAQGVRVPTPVMFYEGVLLMELVVDAAGHPAPRLVEAPPATPEDAWALYLDLRAQVVRMLCADLIHGDLSPYNILMGWSGATIIDFPQTVAAARNNRAEFYFRRDLDNVRNFLAGIDPRLHGAAGDTGDIWAAYVRRDLSPDYQPSGGFRDAPRRNGPPGRKNDRGPRGDRNGLRPESPRPPVEASFQAAPSVPAVELSPEEAAEAELRALEAQVLRQGGGERSKPASFAPTRDNKRRRPFSPGGRPSQGGGGGGGGNRPRSGGPQGANTAQRPQGAPNGQRPQGVPQQARSGQRPQGAPPQDRNGQRPQGAPPERTGQRPQGAPQDRTGQRPQGAPQQARSGPPQGPPQDRRPPRSPNGERRGGAPGSQPVIERRPERGTPPAGPRAVLSEPRQSRPAAPQVSYVSRPAPEPTSGAGGPGTAPHPSGERRRQASQQGRRSPGRR